MDEELKEKAIRIVERNIVGYAPGRLVVTKSAIDIVDEFIALIREAGYVRQEEDIDASAEILNKGIEIGKLMERERNKEPQ